jgi:hypothetical protein
MGYGQHMQVKKPNLISFGQDKKRVTSILDTLSGPGAKRHPEYGILPFNAQCSECVELIDKRTINTRFFVDPYVSYHTFSQSSYFPLHYRNNPADIWRTIDPRLEPDSTHPGVYTAKWQPLPAKCDLNKKSTSITLGGFEFEFNKNITLYYTDENTEAMSIAQPGNYTRYTVGEQGLEVTNMWPAIDMQQIFSTGEIEANYIIRKPLQIPVDKGYMVIEDHFNIPDGYTFEESENGAHLEQQKFKGDYELKDNNHHILATYHKPVYIDANSVGMQGIYKLIRDGNDYILQMLIPVSWLNRAENVYPLTIDPLVSGDSAMGNFISSGLPSANLAFTSVALGNCDYHMSVTVPGMSQLMNTYVNLEYHLTYSNMCGSPPEPAPYCLFSQVNQYLSADKCGQVELLACRGIGDTTGICTTDSSLRFNNGVQPMPATFTYPQFLSCYPPQCADYDIPFTLKNTDSICGDVCGYLCARGSKWEMTIEACTVNASITQTSDHICTGQSDTITAVANCGIPPYHYLWTTNGGSTFDTTYETTDYIIGTATSTDSVIVGCYVADSCGNQVFAGTTHVSVCTGIQTLSDTGFELYPNPAGDMITIRGEGLKGIICASVYDIAGREINTTYQPATGKISLPVAYLSPGMYFISISTNNQSVVMSFVKQ